MIIPVTEMAWGGTMISIGVVSAFWGVAGKRFSFFFIGFSRKKNGNFHRI